MALRPAKRQKRHNVSSSLNGVESSSFNGSHLPTLPTRLRNGSKSVTSRPHSSTSTQTIPAPSTGTPPWNASAEGRSGSLHAFFKATDYTPSSQSLPLTKLDGSVLECEHEDDIEDDSVDEIFENLPDTQGTTRFMLDRRKRSTPTQGHRTFKPSQRVPSASQRLLVHECDAIPETSKVAPTQADSRPWADRFGPARLEELAVHKKKVLDVQRWLKDAWQAGSPKKLLILKGPSGAGKTSTVTLLAKAMGADLLEWKAPTSSYSAFGQLSMSGQFEDFLERGGKFGGLELASDDSGGRNDASGAETVFDTVKPKLILIEEFPTMLSRTSAALKSFRSSVFNYLAANILSTPFAMQEGLNTSIVPIIMIVTETRLSSRNTRDDCFTVHRLLGSDILSHPSVSVIEFNPVAPTYLIKAIDLVIQKEAKESGRKRTPGRSIVEKLGEIGDVRSAIGNLEFLYFKSEGGADWSTITDGRAKKRGKPTTTASKMKPDSLEMITHREVNIGLFHAVGKVVYNKRDEPLSTDLASMTLLQPPSHLAQHARLKVSQVSVDTLIDDVDTDPHTFVAALHENFVPSCESIQFLESLNGCLDVLSDSDLVDSDRGPETGFNGVKRMPYQSNTATELLYQDEICFHIAVRGLLFALPSPVKRQAAPVSSHRAKAKANAFKMFYPQSLQLYRPFEETEALVEMWSLKYANHVLQPEDESNQQSNTIQEAGTRMSTSTSTSTPSSAHGNNPHSAPSRSSEPTLIGNNTSKVDLLLDTLPYASMLERNHSAQLQRITCLTGVEKPDDDDDHSDSDSDGDNSVAAGQSAARARRMESRSMPLFPPATGSVSGSGSADTSKLYLTDDDIED